VFYVVEAILLFKKVIWIILIQRIGVGSSDRNPVEYARS
jgi:hypothetical protein